MTNKLRLYKRACRHLKQTPIAALTDDIFIRYELDDVYSEALDGALMEGDWNFAMRTVAIEHSTDVEPSFGYSYAFEKPEDWVRTSAISANGSLWPPIGPEGFADETTNWHADCDPLYVSYVSNDNNFGLNLANWPETFAEFVALDLAYRIAPTVTGMAKQDKDDLFKQRNMALRNARAKDARNQASQSPPPGRLVTARRGVTSRHYDWRQNG